MQQYTVGFAHVNGFVLLIHKRRGPEAVRGRLNGIGGKMEPGESFEACLSREVSEETGLYIIESRWKHTVTLTNPGWEVRFFTVELTEDELGCARTVEDEPVGIYNLSNLPIYVVPNLRWLIPLSMDPDLKFPITIEDQSR